MTVFKALKKKSVTVFTGVGTCVLSVSVTFFFMVVSAGVLSVTVFTGVSGECRCHVFPSIAEQLRSFLRREKCTRVLLG